MPGSTVLVLGCGPIGCFAVGVARAAGASLVIASDFNPMRLDARPRRWARTSRSTRPPDDVLARVRELTGGDGVDLVCEMSGHPERPRAGVRRRAARRAGQPAGHAEPHHRGRLRPRRDLQGTHALRRHRPQDVRDLGPDAALPPRRPARPAPGHHPPLSARVDRRGHPGHQGRPGGQGDPGDRRDEPLRSTGGSRRSSSSSSATGSTSGSTISTARRRPRVTDGGPGRGHHPLLEQLPRPEQPARGVAAGKAALDRCGAGTASVRFICGTFTVHRALEAACARLVGTGGLAQLRELRGTPTRRSRPRCSASRTSSSATSSITPRSSTRSGSPRRSPSARRRSTGTPTWPTSRRSSPAARDRRTRM